MKFAKLKRDDAAQMKETTELENADTLVEDDGYPHSWKLVIILLGLALGIFLVAIDTIIVSVAIPSISTEFKRLSDVGWYGSAYLLTVTAFQPVAGTMFRLYNIKIVYLTSIVIFEAGSVLCAAAPSSFTLILGRAIAGVGASGLMQGATGTITYIAPLQKRPLYIGLVVSAFGISACCSPIIGGVLTDSIGWRWCFWINLPIGAVVFFLIALFLHVDKPDEEMRKLPWKKQLSYLDPVGVILLLGGVTCLLIALQWGGNKYAWNSATIIGLLVGCALLLLTFGFVQWWLGEMATIPLRILRQRTILFGAIALFFTNWSNNVKLYYLPFYFQAVQGVSAIESAIRFLPIAIPLVIATVIAGALVSKTGYYMPIMITGQVIAAIGSGFLSTIGISTPTAEWAAYSVLTGFGIGLCNQLPFSAVQVVVNSESEVFVGNGILTFAGLAGGAIGVQIGETLLVTTLTREVPKYTSAVTPQTVIAVGALGLKKLTTDPIILTGLRKAYATAVDATIICAVAAICLSIPFAACMQWLNLKKVAACKDQQKARTDEVHRIEQLRKAAEQEEKSNFWSAHLSTPETSPPPVYTSRAPSRPARSSARLDSRTRRATETNRSASRRWSRPISVQRPESSRYSFAPSNRWSLPVMSPMSDWGMNYFFKGEEVQSEASRQEERPWPIPEEYAGMF